MSINAQPSTIKADGTGLGDWLTAQKVTFEQDASTFRIEQADYSALLSSDPWLEALAESGVLKTDLAPAGDGEQGNAGSTSSNSSNSGSNSSQSQTDAGSDAGAGAAGDSGNAGTSDANGAGTGQDASGTSATGGEGNGGAAPDASGNSGSATGSGAQSDASGTSEQNGSSSQDSGSSSDASSSSNSSSATGGDAPAPSPTPAVTPVDPAVITQPVTETSSAVAWLEEFAKTASVDAKAIINTILTYVREMAPGKSQTPESIQRQQVNLNSALSGAINRLDGEFKAVWGGILRLAHEHRDGVFHDRYVFRQLQNAPLNPTQRAFFERTMNMIKLTADPQGRKAGLKQFDKDRTMQHGMTEGGRNRLLSFYNL